MSRLVSYLGVLAALAVFLLLAALAGRIEPSAPGGAPGTASSTISIFPAVSLPPLTIPELAPGGAATTSSETAVERAMPAPKEALPALAPESAPIATPLPALPAAPAPVSNEALDAAATALRAALVNILCYVPPKSGLRSISGSGIFVDPKGIIMTNAHVAQYFLLADKGVRCAVRTGSPAADSYEAALVFIPIAWLRANDTVLTETLPNGTGEHDFALLAVTGSVTRKALPSPFPFIPLATKPPASGTPVIIATYGAQFLESSQIETSLFPTIVFGSVKDIFTFATNTIDVLALGGSAAAQEGSSGGGVADASGKLVGTITTSTVTGSTDTRSLNAITASYIRADYASESGEALDLLFDRDTAASVAAFAPQIPALEALITKGLP